MELFGLFADVLVGLFSSRESSERRRQLRVEAKQNAALGAIAHALQGRVEVPWFRSPRALGRRNGREVTVYALGENELLLESAAPSDLDLLARPASWFQRLFGVREPQVGGASRDRFAPEARRLVRDRGVGQILVRGGELFARVPIGPDPERAWVVCEEVLRMVFAEPAPVPVTVNATSRATDLRCPFCHSGIGTDDVVVSCASCEAPHHPTCFEEGRGCSIAGCRDRKARGKASLTG